jgi:uncharacterized protein (DUF736 family)
MEQRNNNGVMFKNDKKEKESHPDYKGNCIVNGKEMWVSAWVKTSQKNGNKFLSLAFSDKTAQVAKSNDEDLLF